MATGVRLLKEHFFRLASHLAMSQSRPKALVVMWRTCTAARLNLHLVKSSGNRTSPILSVYVSTNVL